MRIVQALAGEKPNKSSEEIFAATSIDPRTIALAAQKPLAQDSADAVTAKAMFDDKYGAGKARHQASERVARAKLEDYQRVRAPLDDPSATAEQKESAQKLVDAMKSEVIAAWNAYATLATESDALAVGNQAEAATAAP